MWTLYTCMKADEMLGDVDGDKNKDCANTIEMKEAKDGSLYLPCLMANYSTQTFKLKRHLQHLHYFSPINR